MDGNLVRVGQIDVGEGQGSRGGPARREKSARRGFSSRKGYGLRAGGDDRNVVGAGDRDSEFEGRKFIVGRVIVIDSQRIGQLQRLAGGKEVERPVGDGVIPAGRTVVIVARSRSHNQIDFNQLDVVELLRIQRQGISM